MIYSQKKKRIIDLSNRVLEVVEIKLVLTIKDLIRSAERFCEAEDEKDHLTF